VREINRDYLFTPTLENLDVFVRERIFVPLISEFYDSFVRNGTNQTLIGILERVPSEFRPPVLHTLITHPTKEKPTFVYGIGKILADENRVRFVAASTDLLWCLSLIVDDIVDGDIQRASRETAWVVYGVEETYKSAQVVYATLQSFTESVLSPQEKALLAECVDEGVKSLGDPAIRGLDTSIEAILENIDRRARFHCEYPIKALSPLGITEVASLAIEGLFSVNRAGQILNDIKDLIPLGVYGRNLFSDLSGGVATIPLVALYQVLRKGERELLEHCFGNPSFVTENVDSLNRIITLKLPRKGIYSLVLTNYMKFLDLMETTISPDYFPFCQKWVDYKLDQGNRLLFG